MEKCSSAISAQSFIDCAVGMSPSKRGNCTNIIPTARDASKSEISKMYPLPYSTVLYDQHALHAVKQFTTRFIMNVNTTCKARQVKCDKNYYKARTNVPTSIKAHFILSNIISLNPFLCALIFSFIFARTRLQFRRIKCILIKLCIALCQFICTCRTTINGDV